MLRQLLEQLKNARSLTERARILAEIKAYVMQTGPRGGKFYYAKSGRKIYRALSAKSKKKPVRIKDPAKQKKAGKGKRKQGAPKPSTAAKAPATAPTAKPAVPAEPSAPPPPPKPTEKEAWEGRLADKEKAFEAFSKEIEKVKDSASKAHTDMQDSSANVVSALNGFVARQLKKHDELRDQIKGETKKRERAKLEKEREALGPIMREAANRAYDLKKSRDEFVAMQPVDALVGGVSGNNPRKAFEQHAEGAVAWMKQHDSRAEQGMVDELAKFKARGSEVDKAVKQLGRSDAAIDYTDVAKDRALTTAKSGEDLLQVEPGSASDYAQQDLKHARELGSAVAKGQPVQGSWSRAVRDFESAHRNAARSVKSAIAAHKE